MYVDRVGAGAAVLVVYFEYNHILPRFLENLTGVLAAGCGAVAEVPAPFLAFRGGVGENDRLSGTRLLRHVGESHLFVGAGGEQ